MSIIYCYTNKINGKTYIGQTNNPQRRIREHHSNAFNIKSVNYGSVFHKALRKYGIEGFEYAELETIENNQELLNSRECFWISKKRSQVHQNGYNVLEGGRSKFWNSKFAEKEIEEIKFRIGNEVSYDTLAEDYKVSKSFLSGINHGKVFFNSQTRYPLCSYGLGDIHIDLLLEHLRESKLTFSEIAEALDMSVSTVKKINYGKIRKELSREYPIRKLTPQERRSNEVKDFLINTSHTNTEILKMTNVSMETVRRINLGITNKDEALNYPLRNFVETIRN